MNNITTSAHAQAHVNVAVHAIQLAFSMTPRAKHQQLLDNIYNEVVYRCFRTDLSQLRTPYPVVIPAEEHDHVQHTRP